MRRSTIKGKMITFVNDYFIKDSGVKLDADTSLLEKGIIDSTGVIELVSFVEATFGIKVEDEEIIPENFDSINKLVDLIQPKLARQPT